jgi:hypothetical protein
MWSKFVDFVIIAGVWVFTLLLVMAILQPAEARAPSPNTRAACTNSYLSFCGHTTPGTPQCRSCFRNNWKRLDHACQAAIRADKAYAHHFKSRR